MSRSIHQTRKSVFGGKSKREIEDMISNEDHDVEQLIKKNLIKGGILDSRGHRTDEDDSVLPAIGSTDAEQGDTAGTP